MVKTFFESFKRYKIKFIPFTVLFIILALGNAAANIIGARATGDMAQAAEFGLGDDMIKFLIILIEYQPRRSQALNICLNFLHRRIYAAAPYDYFCLHIFIRHFNTQFHTHITSTALYTWSVADTISIYKRYPLTGISDEVSGQYLTL